MSQPPAADLFRKEARDHRLSSEVGRRRLDVSPPWTWALLWLVLAALTAALVLSTVGSIEVNSRAEGIVRPASGVRTLVSPVSGSVSSVLADSGARVEGGEVVLEIDAPEQQAQLLEAEQLLELLESDFHVVSQRLDLLHQQQVEQMRARLEKLVEQLNSERTSLDAQRHKYEAMRSLQDSGVVSRFAVLDAQEAVAQAERRVTSVEQSLAAARTDLAALHGQHEAELWNRRQSLDSARARREARRLSSRQSAILAPESGLIEALLVKPGDDVRPGQVLGKLIPTDAPLRIISFLPEKDRAFVKVGSEVRLELDQLPYGEYGTLGARVVRIGDDLASAREVEQSLGDGHTLRGPTIRVELEITDFRAASDAGVRLRSGMLMQVRYTLRRQRPITVVLEPLRKWLR